VLNYFVVLLAHQKYNPNCCSDDMHYCPYNNGRYFQFLRDVSQISGVWEFAKYRE